MVRIGLQEPRRIPRDDSCIFCEVADGTRAASVVYADELTVAFIDARQFNPGHTLVVSRQHISDVRNLDEMTGAAVMATVIRVAKAVDAAFPSDGMSLWHSIGPAAFQEVPHLHIHIHPRKTADGVLRVYPSRPPTADRSTRDDYAEKIRAFL